MNFSESTVAQIVLAKLLKEKLLLTDGEEDGEIELATAVLTPISECVKKKYQESLLFFIAIDVSSSKYLSISSIIVDTFSNQFRVIH